jgi:endonuclease/exonuclease/phosphatase family metal-dependent hydrolase
VLVRTWNLFNGNTFPPGRRAYLQEMVELITADKPDVVCLQEVPIWAFGSIGGWARMKAVTARARRPTLGPIPIPPLLGKSITSLHHGLIRSAFAGQGNVILIPADAKIRSTKTTTLNTNVYCEERGAKLGLTPKAMRAWERERRICHLVHYELPTRQRVLVGNLHATSYQSDPRLADAELRRAASFVDHAAELEEVVILAGDFNLTREQSRTIQELESEPPESRWRDVGPHIDHILFRGAVAESERVWPDSERGYDGKILSDHAPVEVSLSVGS